MSVGRRRRVGPGLLSGADQNLLVGSFHGRLAERLRVAVLGHWELIVRHGSSVRLAAVTVRLRTPKGVPHR